MNMRMRPIAIIVFIGIVTALANAGPFGIEMGMTLQQIESLSGAAAKEFGIGYEIQPPKVHPSFDVYVALISPTLGVYKIVAFGKSKTVSSFGTELKSDFDKIRKQIEVVYGPSKVFDFLKYGSIWKEPNDWMMGLKQKERTLVAFWDDETGADMSSTVANIMLDATQQVQAVDTFPFPMSLIMLKLHSMSAKPRNLQFSRLMNLRSCKIVPLLN